MYLLKENPKRPKILPKILFYGLFKPCTNTVTKTSQQPYMFNHYFFEERVCDTFCISALFAILTEISHQDKKNALHCIDFTIYNIYRTPEIYVFSSFLCWVITTRIENMWIMYALTQITSQLLTWLEIK